MAVVIGWWPLLRAYAHDDDGVARSNSESKNVHAREIMCITVA
jgi:hypothetical protein